jgi:integrase
LPGTGIYTKEPKTESSKRAIKLSVSAIEMLKDFKKWQLEQGLKMGDQWHDTDRIFTKANGQPIHPDTITGWFRSFVKRNNLPNICVHSLRHTCITLLISAGIPIPTVSKRAGHANPGITTMIYSHAIKSLDERAAEALDEIVMRI